MKTINRKLKINLKQNVYKYVKNYKTLLKNIKEV